jgi:methylated-DNA-[protein]-cysteine S-methyltransferase
MHRYGEVETEIGKLRVGCSLNGVHIICLAEGSRKAFESACQKRFGIRPQQGVIPESFRHAVIEAAAGRGFESVPIDLSSLSEFQQTVLRTLQQVPRGEVRSYTWLARKAGRPRAARAVGNTMARNPVPILIPCHRIVPAKGGIGNYGMGSALKRKLLQREGVVIDQRSK